ncbi:MAG: M23 family metallopeptidase [Bacillota bacterium]
MTDRPHDTTAARLKAALEAVAEQERLPDRLQRPSALALAAAERSRAMQWRLVAVMLAAALLLSSAGLAVAAQGLLRSAPEAPPQPPAAIAPPEAPEVEGPELESLRLSAPVENPVVTDRFGLRRHPLLDTPTLHAGMDFAGSAGTPVLAAADGKVIAVEQDRTYGKSVGIYHGTLQGAPVVTWYSHNQKVTVTVGQRVSRGEQVAEIGKTGYTIGPHLHFEVRVDGLPVDPLLWLETR